MNIVVTALNLHDHTVSGDGTGITLRGNCDETHGPSVLIESEEIWT